MFIAGEDDIYTYRDRPGLLCSFTTWLKCGPCVAIRSKETVMWCKASRSLMTTLLLWCCFGLLSQNAAGAIYVNDNAPNDLGPGDPMVSDPLEDGSFDHPYDTIQEGVVHAAAAGDNVHVAAGAYTDHTLGTTVVLLDASELAPLAHNMQLLGGWNENFSVREPTLHQSSIDGEGLATCVTLVGSIEIDFSGVKISGFTVLGGANSGIRCISASPEMSRNFIIENTGEAGGGVYCEDGSPVFINNQISANTATGGASKGGGITCHGSSATLLHNTICDNVADIGGGACSFEAGTGLPTLTLTNNILWGNLGPAGPQLGVGPDVTLDIDYCDVQGGQGAADIDPAATVFWGSNNIDADPLFVDAAYGDYHLTEFSACKDTGTDAGVYIDIEGHARPLWDGFDMGGYERNTISTQSPTNYDCPSETECPEEETECPQVETECPEVETECPEENTLCPQVSTECPVVVTTCPEQYTDCPKQTTQCPQVETECPQVDTECPATHYTDCPTIPTVCPLALTRCPAVPTDCPVVASAVVANPTFAYEGMGIIQLDATTSCGATTFQWAQTAGIAVMLDEPFSPTPSFAAPAWDGVTELPPLEATLRFLLVINPGEPLQDADECEVYVRIPGDANGDDVVNAFDVAAVRRLDPEADFNGDGGVNGFDVAILRQNAGRRRTAD